MLQKQPWNHTLDGGLEMPTKISYHFPLPNGRQHDFMFTLNTETFELEQIMIRSLLIGLS